QVEGVLLVADHHGVARVVAALVPHDVVDVATEQVGGLALALIAPLGAHENDCRHALTPVCVLSATRRAAAGPNCFAKRKPLAQAATGALANRDYLSIAIPPKPP